MAENLKAAQESDGTAIPFEADHIAWRNLGNNNVDKAYCYYNNSSDGLAKYGALYTFAAANVACPTTWHLPTVAEWTILETYLTNDGNYGAEGTALKSTIGWTSTDSDSSFVHIRNLYYDSAQVGYGNSPKSNGFAVRSVKD